MRTAYCAYPKYSTVLFGASYNGSAPRGSSYYNYIGNGRCVSHPLPWFDEPHWGNLQQQGPGVTAAVNVTDNIACIAAGGGAGSDPNFASTAAAACSGAGAAASASDNSKYCVPSWAVRGMLMLSSWTQSGRWRQRRDWLWLSRIAQLTRLKTSINTNPSVAWKSCNFCRVWVEDGLMREVWI